MSSTGEAARGSAPSRRQWVLVVLLSLATCAGAFFAVIALAPARGGKPRQADIPNPYTATIPAPVTTTDDPVPDPPTILDPPLPFTTFAGAWYNHTGGLHIDAGLHFVLLTDVYCTGTETCAKRQGPTYRGTLTPETPDGRARAAVSSSSDPGTPYPKSVTVVYDPAHDSLKMGALGEFCGPKAPPGYCGA